VDVPTDDPAERELLERDGVNSPLGQEPTDPTIGLGHV
jgi:hypothetical protein